MAEEEKFEIEDIKDPLNELEESEAIEEGDDSFALEEEMTEEQPPEEVRVERSKPEKRQRERSQKVKKVKEITREESKKEEQDVLEQAVSEEKSEASAVEKKKSGILKTVLLVFLTMLVTTAIVLGGVYYWLYRSIDTEKVATENTVTSEKTEKEDRAQEKVVYATSELGLNLRKEPSVTAEILSVIPRGTKLAVLEERTDWYKTKYQEKEGWVSREYVSEKNPLVYENKEYGFSLTFPEGWVGYKVFPVKIENFGIKSFFVALPTQDKQWKEDNLDAGYASFLALTVMTEEEWIKASSEEGPKPTFLKKSDELVYVWTPAQAGPADISAKMKDVSSIIKTFELK